MIQDTWANELELSYQMYSDLSQNPISMPGQEKTARMLVKAEGVLFQLVCVFSDQLTNGIPPIGWFMQREKVGTF